MSVAAGQTLNYTATVQTGFFSGAPADVLNAVSLILQNSGFNVYSSTPSVSLLGLSRV